jgi:hypothetical protein
LKQLNSNNVDDDPTDTVYDLKDQLSAFYNIVQLNFFTHMMHNACKYDNDDQCDVEASALPHFHAETLDEYKDTLLIPLR